MSTIDASVWVNGFDQRDVGYAVSRQFLDRVRVDRRRVMVPHLVLVDVAGAISRTRQHTVHAQAFHA